MFIARKLGVRAYGSDPEVFNVYRPPERAICDVTNAER
jgi:hypothetical protein